MKKSILTIILILVTVFSLIYAFIKADEAEKNAEMARIAQAESEELRDQAVELQQLAQESAEEAQRQAALALQALDDCQSK